MKKIKDLTVTVTYTVGLGDVEVSDEIYEALSNCYDKGGEVSPDSFDSDETVACDWLSSHIRESDAMEWQYEIDDFNED